MKARIALLLTGFLTLGLASPCRAGFIVSLSSPDNLSALNVGQTITINVTLSGDVSALNPLDSLGVTVVDPPAPPFNTPTILAGSIVPDLTGFFTAPSTGVADATYDVLFSNSNTPITTNGVFFTAHFTATAPGTGTFHITNLNGFQGFNPVTVTDGTPGGALTFSVAAPTSAVPEPASLLLAGIGGACALGGAWRARRRDPRAPTPADLPKPA
jgi:hypothetical protein